MTLDEFLALDYEGRLKATNQAVCIGGRSNATHMILLYQLNGFYIEVLFDRQHNHISSFHAFNDMDLLDPYLKKIEISLTY